LVWGGEKEKRVKPGQGKAGGKGPKRREHDVKKNEEGREREGGGVGTLKTAKNLRKKQGGSLPKKATGEKGEKKFREGLKNDQKEGQRGTTGRRGKKIEKLRRGVKKTVVHLDNLRKKRGGERGGNGPGNQKGGVRTKNSWRKNFR